MDEDLFLGVTVLVLSFVIIGFAGGFQLVDVPGTQCTWERYTPEGYSYANTEEMVGGLGEDEVERLFDVFDMRDPPVGDIERRVCDTHGYLMPSLFTDR